MSRLREWLLKILLRKEVPDMAVVYATLIVRGRKLTQRGAGRPAPFHLKDRRW